jgi:broad specificity phosphatase PhoE
LSSLGEAQSAALRGVIRELNLQQGFTSPMRRCLETCRIVAPDFPFEIRRELREIHFGEWEGKTLAWLEEHDPHGVAQRRLDPVTFRPPGGESFADVAVRLRAFIARFDFAVPALIVGHRGTLAVLERLLRGLQLNSQIPSLGPGELRVLDSNVLSAGQRRSRKEASVGRLKDFAPVTHHRNAGSVAPE